MMTSLLDWDRSTPVLDGPDEYHVYASCDPDDDIATAVLLFLEHEGFFLYKDDPDRGNCDNIETGIDCCRNVIFFMTSSARRDWLDFEIQQTLQKVKVRGKGSVIVVTKDVKVPRELRSFTRLQYSEDEGFKGKFMCALRADPHPPMATLSKENFGSALAYSHFYGYLKFVLPALHKRVRECGMMKRDASGDVSRNMSEKMFVVMPESCKCPTSLTEVDSALTVSTWIPFKASRAGIVDRDYKSAVYSLKDEETGKEYFLVVEMPSILTNLLDMYQGGVSGLSLDDKNREMRQFYFQLKALLAHDKYRLDRKAVIIYYKDQRSGCEKLSQLLLERLKQEIAEEAAQEAENDPSPEDDTSADVDGMVTVRVSEGRGSKLVQDEELLPCYSMDSPTCGIALVINNCFFTNLTPRDGSDVDEATITALFRDFHFTVETHHDQTAAEMSDLVARLASRNHTKYDAVICCIMSHGQLGKIYGSDCNTVEITRLAGFFASTPSLYGKPKMFFIQACQKGAAEEAPETTACSGGGASGDVLDSSAQDVGGSFKKGSGDNDGHFGGNEGEGGGDNGEGFAMVEIPSAEHEVLNYIARHPSMNDDAVDEVGKVQNPVHPATSLNLTGATPNCESQAEGADVRADAACDALPRDMQQLSIGDRPPEADGDPLSPTRRRTELVPGSPDFLMSYSTLPGSLSFRNAHMGSYYIASVDRNIRLLSKLTSVDRILMKVANEVEGQVAERLPRLHLMKHQFPFYLHTMDKLVYFHV